MHPVSILDIHMNVLIGGDFEWFLSETEGRLFGWEGKKKGMLGDTKTGCPITHEPFCILPPTLELGMRLSLASGSRGK